MFQKHLLKLYQRDLDSLIVELKAYQSNESLLWVVLPGTSNAAGNLFLHLIGNLNHFIGTVVLENGFVRQRELEFSSINIPLTSILIQLESLKELLKRGFDKLDTLNPDSFFSIEMNGRKFTNLEFLIHLFGHLNYHLGQINYHRRMNFA